MGARDSGSGAQEKKFSFVGLFLSNWGHVTRREGGHRQACAAQGQHSVEALEDSLIGLGVTDRLGTTFTDYVQRAYHSRVRSCDPFFCRVTFRRFKSARYRGGGINARTRFLRILKAAITGDGHAVTQVNFLRRRDDRQFTRSVAAARRRTVFATDEGLMAPRRLRSTDQDYQRRAERASERAARVSQVRAVCVLAMISHFSGLLF